MVVKKTWFVLSIAWIDTEKQVNETAFMSKKSFIDLFDLHDCTDLSCGVVHNTLNNTNTTHTISTCGHRTVMQILHWIERFTVTIKKITLFPYIYLLK